MGLNTPVLEVEPKECAEQLTAIAWMAFEKIKVRKAT